MSSPDYGVLIAGIVIIGPLACIILVLILKSPFAFPYFFHSFDVSGKRNPQINDLIDEYFIAGNFDAIQKHYDEIQRWKEKCQSEIEHSLLKNYRAGQFQECLDDEHAFQFSLTRQQTRYSQQYYVKSSYKVTQTVDSFSCDYSYLKSRDDELREIGYECTLQNYHNKNQRKLMTKELREKVIARDNYTC